MNLLGCSKENFYKLMTYMNYKKDKTIDTYIFKIDRLIDNFQMNVAIAQFYELYNYLQD